MIGTEEARRLKPAWILAIRGGIGCCIQVTQPEGKAVNNLN